MSRCTIRARRGVLFLAGACLLAVVLYLPLRPATAGEREKSGKVLEGVVNLNTAPPGLLLLLPGVGPGRVRGILAYRARRPFRTIDELVRIRGIGRRMVREIRPHLAVTGPSTARGGPGQAVPAPVIAAPPAPPVRPLCRPNPPLPIRPPVPKSRVRVVRSVANHCAPPA